MIDFADLVKKPQNSNTPKSVDFADLAIPEIPKDSPEQAAALTRMQNEPGMGQIQPGRSLRETFMGPPSQTAKEWAPILLATAASAAVPPAALPIWAARLSPAIKYLASQALTKVPAAFAGGGAGGMIREQAKPEATAGSIGKAGLSSGTEMALWELLGGSMTATLAPGYLRASMSPAAKIAAETAKQYKIPVEQSTLAPSFVRKVESGASEYLLPGRVTKDFYRRRAITRMNQVMGEELPRQIGQLKPPEIANQEAVKAFRQVFSQAETEAKIAATQFLDQVGRNTKINVVETSNILRKIKLDAQDNALRVFAQDKLNRIGKGGTLPADSLETALRQIGEIGAKRDKKYLEFLRTAIKSDFTRHGADVSKLELANAGFKEIIGALTGTTARQTKAAIAKGFEPPNLATKVFTDENIGLMNFLKQKLPKSSYDDMRASNLAAMFKNASKESAQLPGMWILDGQKLKTIIERNRRVLTEAYKDQPHILKNLEALADLGTYTAKDMAKFERGTSKILPIEQAIGLGAATYANPGLMIPGMLGTMILARNVMQPKGVFSTLIAESANIGGRAATDWAAGE